MSKIIASIWPMEEVASRPMFEPNGPDSQTNVFVLRAGSVEAPSIIRIGNFKQRIYMGKDHYDHKQIDANDIANDLVQQWRDHKGGTEDAGLPGIWVFSEDDATADKVIRSAELAEWHDRQMLFAQSKVREGRMLAARNEWRNITRMHIAMGTLLNLKNEDFMSFDPKDTIGKVPCPFCAASIPLGSAICQSCKEIVDINKYNQILAAQGRTQKINGVALPAVDPALAAKAAQLEAENAKLKTGK